MKIFKQAAMTAFVLAYIAGIAAAHDEGLFRRRYGDEKTIPQANFVITTAHGIGTGAYTGLAAGWVRYQDREGMQPVWDSVGYGALGGLGAGLAAAIIGKDGTGNAALSDLDALGGVGGGIGFLWGVTSALFTAESRRVGDGMGWGHLGGIAAGIGLVTYKIASGEYRKEAAAEYDTTTTMSIQKDSADRDYLVYSVQHRF